MPSGDSAVVLVAITKLGRGKPLVIETVANSETGFGYRRVSVGIDQNAHLASGSNGAGQVYGPATALYITYSAMWQDQLKRPNLRSGEMDSEEVKLWLAAQQVLCVLHARMRVFCMGECMHACVCVCVFVCLYLGMRVFVVDYRECRFCWSTRVCAPFYLLV